MPACFLSISTISTALRVPHRPSSLATHHFCLACRHHQSLLTRLSSSSAWSRYFSVSCSSTTILLWWLPFAILLDTSPSHAQHSGSLLTTNIFDCSLLQPLLDTSPSHAQHSGLICSTLLPSALTALALATYDVGALPRRGASRAGQHSGVMGLHIRHDELSPTVIHRTNSKNRRQ